MVLALVHVGTLRSSGGTARGSWKQNKNVSVQKDVPVETAIWQMTVLLSPASSKANAM